jgi:hypothetical protein
MGLFNEAHQGEIDPGILYVYDENGLHVGYVWINREPTAALQGASGTKFALLFAPYLKIPGNPGFQRVADTNLSFKWMNKQLGADEAIKEYHDAEVQAQKPESEWILVKQVGSISRKSKNAQV